jgi:SAM-dependent methyltransferase
MEKTFQYKGDHYDELVARQVDQYKEMEEMHDLPPIFNYWSSKYIAPEFSSITGCKNSIEFYAVYFQKSLEESGSKFLLSIGSGDCSMEINIVKQLLSRGVKDFFFICLEISPLFVEKARRQIDKENLGDVMTVSRTDLNKWEPKCSFSGVMAHHSLHHILNLEHVFGLIKKHLAPKGKFLTCDIIGRNGHLRWPEALLPIREIWEKLPRKYKFSNQLNRYYDYFENWDCSVEGFEGIRSQDILPLLIKSFSFEIFYGFGNLIDPFIDRNFGPNYNPERLEDARFVDSLHALDEKLISDGIVKPTGMIAVMVNEEVKETRVYKNRTPAFAMRDPLLPGVKIPIHGFLENIPYKTEDSDNPLVINEVQEYRFNTKLSFTKEGDGRQYFKYGWANPEKDFTWSVGEAASLLFLLKKPVTNNLIMLVEMIPYKSTMHPVSSIDIVVNNVVLKTIKYDNSADKSLPVTSVNIPADLIRNSKMVEVTFLLPHRRQPQFEAGGDVRPLGMALVSATISEA